MDFSQVEKANRHLGPDNAMALAFLVADLGSIPGPTYGPLRPPGVIGEY